MTMKNFSNAKALTIANDLVPEIRKSSPETVILKYASTNNLSPGHVEAIAAAYNTVKTNAHMNAHPDNRGGDFHVVNAKELSEKYAAELPPHLKAAEEENKAADRRLRRLYARKNGLDETTGERKKGDEARDIPSFEEWRDNIGKNVQPAEDIGSGDNPDALSNPENKDPWAMPKTLAKSAASTPAAMVVDNAEVLEKEARLAVERAQIQARRALDKIINKAAACTPEHFKQAEITLNGRQIPGITHTFDYVASKLPRRVGMTAKRASHGINRLTDESNGLTPLILDLHNCYLGHKDASDTQHDLAAWLSEQGREKAATVLGFTDLVKLAVRTKPAPPQQGQQQQGQTQHPSNPAEQPQRPGKKDPEKEEKKEEPKSERAEKVNVGVDGADPFKGQVLPTYKSMDISPVAPTLEALLRTVQTGGNPGQRHYDGALKQLRVHEMMNSLLRDDPVIRAHAAKDPARVADLASSLLEQGPTLTADRNVMRYTLREALSYDAIPTATVTSLVNAEKAKADTEVKRKDLDDAAYGNKGTLADIAVV